MGQFAQNIGLRVTIGHGAGHNRLQFHAGHLRAFLHQPDGGLDRIFRKHGFAWGGNFRRPDGMHFEWVGEPRDSWDYPSPYCPNLTGGLTESAPVEQLGLEVLTIGGEDHVHAGPGTDVGHDH